MKLSVKLQQLILMGCSVLPDLSHGHIHTRTHAYQPHDTVNSEVHAGPKGN